VVQDVGAVPDLYVWKSPRDVDASAADELIRQWQVGGGDPRESPFESSTDVGWFNRELVKDVPGVVASTDAVPTTSNTPIWLAATDEPPARVVAISLSPGTSVDTVESIVSLAAKYDLVLFDARSQRVYLPLEEMAAYASATFWPAGAVQAAVAGAVGAAIAIVAWLVGIPLLSGVLIVVGAFVVVMSVFTFVAEGRKRIARRG
jgi:hypothetical protein